MASSLGYLALEADLQIRRLKFFLVKPISITVPIWLNIFQVWSNSHKENKAPATAIGTVKIIINGSMKLSNCAASIKISKVGPTQMRKKY
jgi:hypothetical protein